ncbi:MAG: hypothetical protein SFV17_22125 [Candidatus Obscuribacter sp.]|nr:hypothetical protein [Candidatus Obscuribacter sp.]
MKLSQSNLIVVSLLALSLNAHYPAAEVLAAPQGSKQDKSVKPEAPVKQALPVKSDAPQTSKQDKSVKPEKPVPAKSQAPVTAVKTTGKEKPAPTKGKSASRPRTTMLVPPPPPMTPSLLVDPSMQAVLGMTMPVEMLGKETLKEREKEVAIQHKDAALELEAKQRKLKDKEDRAVSFEELYKEGVVSRRELEAAQAEAKEYVVDVERLAVKEHELKLLLERINKRLAALSPKPGKKSLLR